MKNKFILSCLFFVVFANILSAQPTTIQWQKTFGGSESDVANSIQQTSDGGFIIAGHTASVDGNVSGFHGSIDYWIVKTDLTGNITWQKTLGGTADDNAQSVQQTADGGYIVAGYTLSNDGDVSGNHGSYDCWVVKLTPTGNIAWQKALGSAGDEFASSIQQTTDGGYILAGRVNINNTDYLVMKLDPSGNLTWEKTLGGSESDQAFSIKQTSDGGYIVAGSSISNDGDVSGNHGSNDYWVVKLDAAGNLTWQKAFGGTASEEARSIQQTADGGYIVAGLTGSDDGDVSGNHGGQDYWVVKLSATGNLTWQKAFGGTSDEIAQSVQQTSDGGYIIAGSSTSSRGQVSGNKGGQDYWIVKLDGTGNLLWQEAMGGTNIDQAQSIQQTAEGGYIVAGYTASNNGDVSGNHGSLDYWVVKLEPEISCNGSSGDNSSIQKVNMCHNGSTVAVHPCAVQGHLAHGDYLGSCVTYAANRETFIIEDKPKIGFSIYPNTSRGNFIAHLNYNVTGNKDAVIQVVNTGGQIIKQLKVNKADKLNISLTANGIYFVRLISNNEVLTKKVTVIK